MTIVTIYALLGDDLKLIYAPKSSDIYFTNCTIACLFFFSLEVILSSFGIDMYLNSFFFWLDLVSTISLVTDIPPIMDAITGGGGSAETEEGETDVSQQTEAAALARASRGAKLGSKAGRLTRVIRIIRLVRIVKLYKSANHAMAKKEAK